MFNVLKDIFSHKVVYSHVFNSNYKSKMIYNGMSQFKILNKITKLPFAKVIGFGFGSFYLYHFFSTNARKVSCLDAHNQIPSFDEIVNSLDINKIAHDTPEKLNRLADLIKEGLEKNNLLYILQSEVTPETRKNCYVLDLPTGYSIVLQRKQMRDLMAESGLKWSDNKIALVVGITIGTIFVAWKMFKTLVNFITDHKIILIGCLGLWIVLFMESRSKEYAEMLAKEREKIDENNHKHLL